MGAPVGVDVGAVTQQELGDVEVMGEAGPGKGDVENVLSRWLPPAQVGQLGSVVVGIVPVGIAERRLARRVEPAFDGGAIAQPCCMREILGYRPALTEQRHQVGVAVLDGVLHRRRSGWCRNANERRAAPPEFRDVRLTIHPRRALDDRGLCGHPDLVEQPGFGIEPLAEVRDIIAVDRCRHLVHDERLPRCQRGNLLTRLPQIPAADRPW